MVAVYIDLTVAYDHTPRDFLFRLLKIRTGTSHLIAILRKMYEGTMASIRGMETVFEVRSSRLARIWLIWLASDGSVRFQPTCYDRDPPLPAR